MSSTFACDELEISTCKSCEHGLYCRSGNVHWRFEPNGHGGCAFPPPVFCSVGTMSDISKGRISCCQNLARVEL